MLLHIRRGPNSWETMTVPTEEDAIREIKKRYPDAESGPWETDYDRVVLSDRPSGQIKLVYEYRSAPGRKGLPIAQITNVRDKPSAGSLVAN